MLKWKHRYLTLSRINLRHVLLFIKWVFHMFHTVSKPCVYSLASQMLWNTHTQRERETLPPEAVVWSGFLGNGRKDPKLFAISIMLFMQRVKPITLKGYCVLPDRCDCCSAYWRINRVIYLNWNKMCWKKSFQFVILIQTYSIFTSLEIFENIKVKYLK